jgi:hypothetical protein
MAAIPSNSPGKVTVRRVQVARNRDRYVWLFMRLSGVAMLILAVGHMVIQHVLNSSANLTLHSWPRSGAVGAGRRSTSSCCGWPSLTASTVCITS